LELEEIEGAASAMIAEFEFDDFVIFVNPVLGTAFSDPRVKSLPTSRASVSKRFLVNAMKEL
jgi:hypothetical protein